MMLRGTSSAVVESALSRIDVLPPPMPFRSPLDEGLVPPNTVCPLSAKNISLSSVSLFHEPSQLVSEHAYHFSSDPGPKNDQRPVGNLAAYAATLKEFCTQFYSLPFRRQSMSLHIDMKMVRSLNPTG